MRRTVRILSAVAASSLLVACADDPDPTPAAAPLTPEFEPAPASAVPPAPEPAPSPSSGAPIPGAEAETPTDSGPTSPATSTPAPTDGREGGRAQVTDPVGDVTPALADRAPDWADLAGAELTGGAEGFELVVSFGAPVPAAAPDPDHTMNVATFVDVDGDGQVDYEVWANLAPGGWGGAWYDNRAGEARFVEESEVIASVEGGRLVLRFPARLVGTASSFRWSVASEWGRYESIGTVAAARDDAPDQDGAVPFPG